MPNREAQPFAPGDLHGLAPGTLGARGLCCASRGPSANPTAVAAAQALGRTFTLMPRTALQKIGARPEARCVVVGTSVDQVTALGLRPRKMTRSLEGAYDYIHVFVTRSAELTNTLPKLKPHLQQKGMLWVSWPKANAKGTDLNLRTIIAIGYRHGLVESKTISIDITWSAIKFTFPLPGKEYRNSYGRLSQDRVDQLKR